LYFCTSKGSKLSSLGAQVRQLRLQLAEIASIAAVLLRQAQEEARDAKTLAQVTSNLLALLVLY